MGDIPMKTGIMVPDGTHKGVITNVLSRITEYKGEQIEYVNFEIQCFDVFTGEDKPLTLNCSAPAHLSKTLEGAPNSKLARILVGLGYNLNEISSISTEILLKDLRGTEVVFLTVNETTERGTFATIIPESLKISPI